MAAAYARIRRKGIDTLTAEVTAWPSTKVDMYHRTQAIPPGQQQRSPGLPGEAVYAQTGYMCVVENLLASSYTLVAAAAVQVLAQGRLRLHAVITTECWRSEGNRLVERWRASHECDEEGSESVVDGVLAELSEQVGRLRPVVD
ncbi:hypothetical protein [Streptomyces sp. NPDC056690]|uniref:hypothetical protein n=1 Tax=unclassified Streptomyces TaxID=2593676 RepID=UPI003632CC10